MWVWDREEGFGTLKSYTWEQIQDKAVLIVVEYIYINQLKVTSEMTNSTIIYDNTYIDKILLSQMFA